MISIFLPVKPIGKGRPRFSSRTKSAYTPETTRRAENAIALLVKTYMRENDLDITEKPVAMTLTLFYKANTKKVLGKFRVKKPDLDNVIKLVADSCNGIVYIDDAQIVEIIARKVYGDEDGINLEIREIE